MKTLHIFPVCEQRECLFQLADMDDPAPGFEGKELASHFCSHTGFAVGDLIANRPERQKELFEKYGAFRVIHGDNVVFEYSGETDEV